MVYMDCNNKCTVFNIPLDLSVYKQFDITDETKFMELFEKYKPIIKINYKATTAEE